MVIDVNPELFVKGSHKQRGCCCGPFFLSQCSNTKGAHAVCVLACGQDRQEEEPTSCNMSQGRKSARCMTFPPHQPAPQPHVWADHPQSAPNPLVAPLETPLYHDCFFGVFVHGTSRCYFSKKFAPAIHGQYGTSKLHAKEDFNRQHQLSRPWLQMLIAVTRASPLDGLVKCQVRSKMINEKKWLVKKGIKICNQRYSMAACSSCHVPCVALRTLNALNAFPNV